MSLFKDSTLKNKTSQWSWIIFLNRSQWILKFLSHLLGSSIPSSHPFPFDAKTRWEMMAWHSDNINGRFVGPGGYLFVKLLTKSAYIYISIYIKITYISFRELTYPLPRHFWWCTFSSGGICCTVPWSHTPRVIRASVTLPGTNIAPKNDGFQ